MTLMRARDPIRTVRGGAAAVTPSLTVRAGGRIVVRVGAVDRQSGLGEIVARCRARDNRDLASTGCFSVDPRRRPPADNYYPVVVSIPERSATGLWEVHRITVVDRDGNRRSYTAGKDFAPIVFEVVARDGVDCTPPRLLGVQVTDGDPGSDA
jgi:hypothetical protein